MIGDPGPYMSDEGEVWVPRTVPWREARSVASHSPNDPGQALHYIGKDDADLLGFTRDCLCDEVCEDAYRDDEPTGEHPCRVPAYHFRWVER
jgi:hypothetical protein